MEQARYWLWTKRRDSNLSSYDLQASTNDDSWEEQAFAEDAAGPLGGCIWPPRSYSCSFCRREFRSAQALGGHMNVHRRDRARLKQSPGDHHHPHNEILHHDHHNNQNPFSSLGFRHQYPSQVCTLVYSPNPNSDHPVVLASPSSPSRVSAPPSSSQENNCFHEQTSIPPSPSPSLVQQHTKRSSISSPKLCSNSSEDRYYKFSDPRAEGEKNTKIVESRCRDKVDYVKTDLSVSLNLVVRRSRPTVSSGKEEGIGCKRRRIDPSSLSFFMKPSSSIDKCHIQSEELELINPSSMEDLDLELRLGDRPKVK